MPGGNSDLTLLYYFVPEDQENEESLNAFAIPKQQDEITLNDIREHFPLSGTYDIKFRVKFNKKFIYKLPSKDERNSMKSVPSCGNQIMFKANRISWLPDPTVEKKKRHTHIITDKYFYFISIFFKEFIFYFYFMKELNLKLILFFNFLFRIEGEI